LASPRKQTPRPSNPHWNCRLIKYLLIALVVLMVVSPLLWLRQTPGQARITAFRNRALQLGLKVQMVPRADADPADRQPDAVRYLKPLVPDSRGAMPVMDHSWILLRDPRQDPAVVHHRHGPPGIRHQ